VLTGATHAATGRYNTILCLLLCRRGAFKSIDEAREAHVALKAEKDAAHNQRMAKLEATAAAKKRKHAEFMERLSKLDPARKRTRRGRGKGPRVPHQQVDA
jgi:hypothetical protein